MLKFDRPEFVSGVMIVVEKIPAVDEAGKPIVSDGKQVIKVNKYRFFPKDKKQSFQFEDEKQVLQKYGQWFKKA